MAMMTSEDFGTFLEKVPGCFVFIGNGTEVDGKGYLPLHNSGYDFNDDILEKGARFFAEILFLINQLPSGMITQHIEDTIMSKNYLIHDFTHAEFENRTTRSQKLILSTS